MASLEANIDEHAERFDAPVDASLLPAERRRHILAFEIWCELVDGDVLPSAEALLGHERYTFADQTIEMAIDDACHTTVTAIGAGLAAPVDSLPVDVADVPGRSLISRVTEHVLEPIANRAPVGFEAEFTDETGSEVRYRAILLPCASDGLVIDRVIGIMTFARCADDEAAAPATPAVDEAGAPDAATQFTTTTLTYTDEEIGSIIMSYKDKLSECMTIDGALAVALVDLSSGMALATEQGSAKGLNLEVAAAGNTNVLRAKYETMKNLGLKEDIEDILITLDSQIHMIRPATSESGKGLFIYLALDKNKANLAMARHKLRVIEKGLEV